MELLTGQAADDARKQRGLEIAALAIIKKDSSGAYFVPSQFSPAQTQYRVEMGGQPKCDCPDHETRGCRCKHIYAVEFFLKREESRERDGTVTVVESATVTIKKTRKTYPQNWPAYNKAQMNEKREFQALLADLCSKIEEPPRKPGRGRPTFRMADVIFSVVYKVYSTFSGRRFISDLCEAQEKGFIERVPHYNTSFKYIENPDLFPLLLAMIEAASLPLKSVEVDFAVDSTGFAYSRFVRWYDIKYNRFSSEQQWVKLHFACGVKTNVVTAVKILDKDAGDAPQLPALVDATRKNFVMRDVSADKGYSSRDNHDAIATTGATPYIMFKSNTTGDVGGLFNDMFHYFGFRRDDFLKHYHQRSNIESTVMMLKTKFGDAVRSKSEVAAKNEVLCKVLCHNIACLISAMYELDIEPVFAGRFAHKLTGTPINPQTEM